MDKDLLLKNLITRGDIRFNTNIEQLTYENVNEILSKAPQELLVSLFNLDLQNPIAVTFAIPTPSNTVGINKPTLLFFQRVSKMDVVGYAYPFVEISTLAIVELACFGTFVYTKLNEAFYDREHNQGIVKVVLKQLQQRVHAYIEEKHPDVYQEIVFLYPDLEIAVTRQELRNSVNYNPN